MHTGVLNIRFSVFCTQNSIDRAQGLKRMILKTNNGRLI